MSIDINFGRKGMYNEESISINSPDPLITSSCQGDANYFTSCINTTTRPMATNLSKLMT